MNLLSLQRTMARAVMQPLTPSERMSRVAPGGGSMARHAARFIKPNDWLTSFERLEIYNRQYWWRLLASMAEDFPGLQAILGQRRFEALCKAYLADCPSRSFTLRNLGRDLEKWLMRHPRWAGSKHNVALDMVRLEWADIEAFDGKAEPSLRREDFARVPPAKLRMRLQPYISLLRFRYPVDKLVLDIKGLNEDTEFLSNAFQERRKRKRVQAVARLKPAEIFLAVHRAENAVYFRRLTTGQFHLLQAIRDGNTLGQAVSKTFGRRGKAAVPELAQVTQWFQNWAALGWFCAPEKNSRAR
jgi:hypothetical protein